MENGIWRDLRTEYKEEIMERHIIIGAPYNITRTQGADASSQELHSSQVRSIACGTQGKR